MAAQTTRAAVLTATGAPLEPMDLALPDLRPGQVLVDVAFAGLCGTQLLEISGAKGPDKYLPHVLGHEGSGIVADSQGYSEWAECLAKGRFLTPA